MKKKNIRNICLSLLAGVTVLTMGVNGAIAYFTTYTMAEGGHPIRLGDRTQIVEGFDSWTKHVTITSEADSEPVFIRARAFCARYDLEYVSASGNWTREKGVWNEIIPAGADDYWYYKGIVNGGESTDTLDVVIQVPGQTDDITYEDGDSFNVIVIYESTPVRYHEDGTAYADWTKTLDVVTDTGINSGNPGGTEGNGTGTSDGTEGNGTGTSDGTEGNGTGTSDGTEGNGTGNPGGTEDNEPGDQPGTDDGNQEVADNQTGTADGAGGDTDVSE